MASVAAAVACVLIIILSPVAVAEEEPAISETPSGQTMTEEVARDYILWPLVFVDRTSSWHQLSVVPLYVKKASEDNSEKRVHVLWPIYMYKRSDQDVSVRIVPIYTYWRDVYAYEDGEEVSVYYMLFPLIFGGKSPEAGSYFAFFPLFGTLKDFMGRDEIRFILFPLYMEYTKNELHQRNYLWPVLSFSEGGGYDGFRLWPIYGRFEKEGEYRNKFYLWPFFHRQEFDLDEEQPGERMLILPLYAKEDSQRRRYRAYLWPFFSHEWNYARDYEERSTPWPFIVTATGSVERTQIWPLFGHKRTSDRDSRFVAWPIWHRLDYELDEETSVRETALLPFVSKRTVFSESDGIVSHASRFWPLWRFRRYEDGSTYLGALSLLWFYDEIGFERQYAPLWTIYERETAPDGTGHSSALWGLVRSNHTSERSETHVPLLYSHVEDTELEMEKTDILSGLFGSRREGEQRSFRLLYLINIPAGDREGADATE